MFLGIIPEIKGGGGGAPNYFMTYFVLKHPDWLSPSLSTLLFLGYYIGNFISKDLTKNHVMIGLSAVQPLGEDLNLLDQMDGDWQHWFLVTCPLWTAIGMG